MKKIGLFKRIGLAATTFVLCLAMLITCFTFTAPSAVRADEVETADRSKLITLAKDVTVKDSYNYGDKITVPANAVVTAPNGDKVDAVEGKVEANQLGVYKISYTQDEVTYDFKVNVTLAEDYFLYIEYNGADIPTYVENNATGKFTIPAASVMYYDKDGALTKYPGAYTVEVEDSNGNKYEGDNMTFDPTGKNGKVFLTYTATLGEKGTKLLTKTFTVNVQSKVNKSGNPTLAVSGITGDASVNRPVTLPVATVSDKNDDNVKVEVTVLDPKGNPVKKVNVNDDGYATETLADDVVFDNDKSMTFYPTEVGKYKVSYTAYNDFYDANNPSAGGKSSTTEAIIEVADHVAPVFKNTDAYEYLIPETWGLTVKNENGKPVDNKIKKIKFLIPEVVDNKCHMPKDENDTENLISLYFRITDSDTSTTVLTIQNILAKDDKDNKYTANTNGYTADAKFENGEFVFDFANYTKKNSKGETIAKPGTYTVLFRARDKDNNTSSKTYTITLKDEYEDKAKPSTAEVTAPEYISLADGEFTIPYPVYADVEDTRPNVVYRLYTEKSEGVDKNYIDVKGGEQASIVEKEGGAYLVVNEDKEDAQELKLGNNIYYYVGVTDKVGNFRSNAVADDKSFVDVVATGEYQKIAAKTQIIVKANSGNIGYFDDVKFVNADGSNIINAGDKVNAGSMILYAANEDMRYYTGFEVAVYDPQGNYVDVTLVTLSDIVENEEDAYKTRIYIKDISFTAAIPTEKDKPYVMTVRVFDVNGNNSVYAWKLTGVNPSKLNNAETSAIANIGSSGNVNVKYKLHNAKISHIAGNGTYRVVRKISGGIFSVMGNEFTAKTAGSYYVQDGYIDAKDINDGIFDYSEVEFSGANEGNYSFNIVNDAKPVIELQGKMPTYKAKYDANKEDGKYTETNGLVKVPTAVAYTENGMGEVEIDVKDPDGSDVDLTDNTFKADKDGVYTVTYSATYENGEKDSASYTINVGDVLAPRFTVTGGTATTAAAKEGDTFTFKTMELAEGEESTGVTVTKEIYDPSHELISGSTVSGGFSGYANKANNGTEIKLSKVGEYTIVYTAKDNVGNEYKISETLTVTSKGSSTATTWTTLSTVLIIVAIVLLAGVIVYVVRFRKVKK